MSTPINKTHTQAVATVVGSGDSDVVLRSLRRDDENFFSSNANVAISRIIYDVSTGIDIVRGGEIILQLASGAYDIDFAAMGSALSARGNYDIHISGPSSNLDYVTILLNKESGYGPIDIEPNLNPNIFDLVIGDDSVYTVTEFGREPEDNLESSDDYLVSLVRQNANFYLYNITDRVKNIDDLLEYQINDHHQIDESVFVLDNPEISIIRNIDETLKKYDGTYFLEEYVNNGELYTSDDLFSEYIAQVYVLGIELDDGVSFDDTRVLSQGFNEYLDAPVIISDDASYKHGMGLNPRFDDLVRGRDDTPELVHKPYTGIHLAVNVQDDMEYHPEFVRTPVDPVNTKEEMDFLFAGVRTLFLQDILNPYDFMRVPQVLSGNIDTDAFIVDQISNIPVVSFADATDGADIVDSIHPVPVITIIENIPVLDEYQDEWNAVLATEDELTPDDYIRFPTHRDLIIDDQIDKGEWSDLPAMELTSGIVDAPVGVDDLGTVFGIVPNITDNAVFEEDHNRIIGQNTEEVQGTDDFIRFPIVVDLPLEDQIDDVDLVDSLNNNPVPNLSSDYTTSEETTNIQGRGINDSVATEEDIYRQIDFARDIYEVPKNSEGAYFDQDYTSLEERYVDEDLWDDRVAKEYPFEVVEDQFTTSDVISKGIVPNIPEDTYQGSDHGIPVLGIIKDRIDVLENTEGTYFEEDYIDTMDRYTTEDIFDDSVELTPSS